MAEARLASHIITSHIKSMKDGLKRSPLALVVLAFLDEGPMHPYLMQRLIEERGKGEVVNVRQRTSLYQTIARLRRAGLVEVDSTTRSKRHPERTVYRLTDLGRRTADGWLRELLAARA